MDPIQITVIKNSLSQRQAIIWDNTGTPLELMPLQTITSVENFTLQVLNSVDEIAVDNIRLYEAENDPSPLGYVAVKGVGIISSVGTQPEDFDLSNPESIWITLPEIEGGENIILCIEEDAANQTWIIGDVDTPS